MFEGHALQNRYGLNINKYLKNYKLYCCVSNTIKMFRHSLHIIIKTNLTNMEYKQFN